MNYWTVIPTAVRKSKRLSSAEKDLYYEICDNLNSFGYCTLTNAELAKNLDIDERTVRARLETLKEKKFVNVIINCHKHRRWIYLNVPQSQKDKEVSEDDQIFDERKKCMLSSLKKAIIIGTVDFNVLVQKLLESPYLEEVKDNSTQFALTEDQIKFLAQIIRKGKTIDCQIANYPGIDYEKLTKEINRSEFLWTKNNLTLKWILQNAEKIINGDYRSNEFTFEDDEKYNYDDMAEMDSDERAMFAKINYDRYAKERNWDNPDMIKAFKILTEELDRVDI